MIDGAIASYASEVRARTFPAPEHTYKAHVQAGGDPAATPAVKEPAGLGGATKKPKTPSS